MHVAVLVRMARPCTTIRKCFPDEVSFSTRQGYPTCRRETRHPWAARSRNTTLHSRNVVNARRSRWPHFNVSRRDNFKNWCRSQALDQTQHTPQSLRPRRTLITLNIGFQYHFSVEENLHVHHDRRQQQRKTPVLAVENSPQPNSGRKRNCLRENTRTTSSPPASVRRHQEI